MFQIIPFTPKTTEELVNNYDISIAQVYHRKNGLLAVYDMEQNEKTVNGTKTDRISGLDNLFMDYQFFYKSRMNSTLDDSGFEKNSIFVVCYNLFMNNRCVVMYPKDSPDVAYLFITIKSPTFYDVELSIELSVADYPQFIPKMHFVNKPGEFDVYRMALSLLSPQTKTLRVHYLMGTSGFVHTAEFPIQQKDEVEKLYNNIYDYIKETANDSANGMLEYFASVEGMSNRATPIVVKYDNYNGMSFQQVPYNLSPLEFILRSSNSYFSDSFYSALKEKVFATQFLPHGRWTIWHRKESFELANRFRLLLERFFQLPSFSKFLKNVYQSADVIPLFMDNPITMIDVDQDLLSVRFVQD